MELLTLTSTAIKMWAVKRYCKYLLILVLCFSFQSLFEEYSLTSSIKSLTLNNWLLEFDFSSCQRSVIKFFRRYKDFEALQNSYTLKEFKPMAVFFLILQMANFHQPE